MSNEGLIVSALQLTDPALAAAIDAPNSWRIGIKTRASRVAKYRRYERGDHDANITTQMRKMLRLPSGDTSNLTDFNINYTKIVIDKMAGRLKVSEIAVKDQTGQAYIEELTTRNDFTAFQGTMFRGAIRDGDSYAMVDPQTLKWTSEPAYDGFSGIVAIFNPMQDYPAWACKVWSEADTKDLAGEDPASTVTMRLMVYQPGRITHWKGQMNAQEVEPVMLAQEQGGQPVSENEMTWPLGFVPVIHFANSADNYTKYGESEIRVAVPAQDVLNRTLHSMVMASEFAAFKVSWSIGMEVDKSGIAPGDVINLVLTDPAGAIVTEMTEQQIEFLKAVRVGEFEATDISQYTNQLSDITKHISQVTQTPIYGITAEGNLSGEALKQLEIGLIGKCVRFQNENSAAIKLLIELTAAIQAAFDTGLGQPPALDGISVNWASPEILDATAAVASILAIREKAPGLFDDDFIRARIGALLGMTQSQIAEESDKAKNAQGFMLDSLTGAAGNVPPGQRPAKGQAI